jgi:hypothetical protein
MTDDAPVDDDHSSDDRPVPHLLGDNGRPTGQRGALLYFRTGSEVVVPQANQRMLRRGAVIDRRALRREPVTDMAGEPVTDVDGELVYHLERPTR